MSTTTPRTEVAADSAVDEQTSRTWRRREVIAGLCLIAAPIAFTAAELIAPEADGNSAQMLSGFAQNRTGGLLAAAFGLVSTMLFIPAVFGLLTRITARGSRWGHVAVAAIIYGLVTAHAALGGVNLMFYAMTDPTMNRGQMVRLMDVLTNSPVIAAPLLLGHQVFAVGVVALGVAVLRSRRLPRWTGVALILWLVVDVVAEALPTPHLVGPAASDGFGVVGLATMGWYLLRGGRQAG